MSAGNLEKLLERVDTFADLVRDEAREWSNSVT